MGDTLSVSSYPVVNGIYEMEGQVWMDTELKDSLVVCREKEEVTLYTLRKVMEYCAKHNVSHYKARIPTGLSMALSFYGSQLILPTDEQKQTIADYEVCLRFETGEHGIRCMVYSSNESDFYFYEYFADDDADYSDVGLINRPGAIRNMARLRDNYLLSLKYEGLRSIRFTTKQKNYQDFVDRLNNYKVDEGV